MTNHNLLSDYGNRVRILMYRYGETGIKDEDIMKYIYATLHKYLPADDAEAIIAEPGTIHRKYKLIHDPEDPNGLYKIYKVSEGYLITTEVVVARFWIESSEKDVSVKEFLSPKKVEVEQSQ